MPPRPISRPTGTARATAGRATVARSSAGAGGNAPRPVRREIRRAASCAAMKVAASCCTSASPAAAPRARLPLAPVRASSVAWNSSLTCRQRPGSRRRAALQLARQPCARHRPLTLHGGGRDLMASAVSSTVRPPKNRSSTRRACSASSCGEPVEGLIEREQSNRRLSAGHQALVERDARCRAPPRFGASRARARSIRIWRIESAAMAKKCARFCQRTGFLSAGAGTLR